VSKKPIREHYAWRMNPGSCQPLDCMWTPVDATGRSRQVTLCSDSRIGHITRYGP
jgi:hypothetical protein